MGQSFSGVPLTQEQSDAILEPHLVQVHKAAEYQRYQWQLLEKCSNIRDFRTTKGLVFRPQAMEARGLFKEPAAAWLAEKDGSAVRMNPFRHRATTQS